MPRAWEQPFLVAEGKQPFAVKTEGKQPFAVKTEVMRSVDMNLRNSQVSMNQANCLSCIQVFAICY
jgi:hypothetical protein